MSHIFINGLGAVSPAGWGTDHLWDAVTQRRQPPLKELKRPGWGQPVLVRQVPTPSPRPQFMMHPRLRRASPITHYAVGAALEALGDQTERVRQGSIQLGIVYCAMTGCVNYSRRFYDEALRDPATASPLVFPETVFNAPSSHLAALLETKAINYTLVGDPGTFLHGLALAAEWLSNKQVQACLVIGAEESEWLAVDAYRLLAPAIILGDGAGALLLTLVESGKPGVELAAITDAHLFHCQQSRFRAAAQIQAELTDEPMAELLCDGLQGIAKLDYPEASAWAHWTRQRFSPKQVLGEGLMAGSAWQCVIAAEALRRGLAQRANISVVGCNEQAIGAQFRRGVQEPE